MMQALVNSLRLLGMAGKSLTRNRLSSVLTLLGIAAGMFLYTGVEALQGSLRRTLAEAADESALTVYQKDRFCPNTSRLRDSYAAEIRADAKLKQLGVTAAYPMLVRVNNCGAGLDAVTFRGVPAAYVHSLGKRLRITAGSLKDFPQQRDAAVVPEAMAAARGLHVGDRFEAAGVTVTIAALSRSDRTEAATSIYTELEFLQQQTVGLGIATLIHVEVNKAEQLRPVAAAIDARYHAGPVETKTHTQQEFFEEAAAQMLEIVAFSRWLGPGALLAVLGILANSVLLNARRRMKEAAVYQCIGWQRRHIALLTMWEGVLLGLAGGAMGAGGCAAALAWHPLALSNEGVSMAVSVGGGTLVTALGAAVGIGLAATLYPALAAARKPLAQSLR